jgi:hypothetical protein
VFIVEGYDELDDLVELAEAGKGEHERLSRTEQILSNSISFGNNSIGLSHSLPCMLVKQAPHQRNRTALLDKYSWPRTINPKIIVVLHTRTLSRVPTRAHTCAHARTQAQPTHSPPPPCMLLHLRHPVAADVRRWS